MRAHIHCDFRSSQLGSYRVDDYQAPEQFRKSFTKGKLLRYHLYMKDGNIHRLPQYLDNLQSRGIYYFLKSDALAELGMSLGAYKTAANRLIKKRRLAFVKPNFYVIVPTEYRSLGCLPASWFINDLMDYLGIPYYVGLLTAAAIHGAGHQQPTVFQVVVNKLIRSINKGEVKIDFVCLKFLREMPIMQMKTATGYMRVATPETTAFDLVRYLSQAAQINNVATVLSELSEKLNADKLIAIAQDTPMEVSVTQRLGYLLDYIKSRVNTDGLAKLVLQNDHKYTSLVTGKTGNNSVRRLECKKNDRWKIIINEKVEPDL